MLPLFRSPKPQSDDEQNLPEGLRKKIVPHVALPALTYEYLKGKFLLALCIYFCVLLVSWRPYFCVVSIAAAIFQLYPPSDALMNISQELARYRDSQEKELRLNIGKVLQYFRRYYLPNGTKIKAKSAEPRLRGIKRKASNPTVTPARKDETPVKRNLFSKQNDGHDSGDEFLGATP